jgi:hypothetical protein
MNNEILNKSFTKALNGGISGATAMGIQVTSLMWLRTTMNNQYRYGGTTINTIKSLYSDGGILRFYRGYLPALLIGPLARFGDVAANEYTMNRLDNSNISTNIKTLAGSSLAASWRAFLMPLDALKTTLQVEGKPGLQILRNKINTGGYRVLYHGTLASMTATFVGHYPWFLTYNVLNQNLPKYDETYKTFLRNGFIGFNAAVISDCCSNSFRVIKTTKQTYQNSISYVGVTKEIINKDGIQGLLGRGLKTRIITNGIQGIIFTISFKYIYSTYFN